MNITANKKNPRRAKLLPCPFDGAEAKLQTVGRVAHLPYSVRCTKCNAQTTYFRIAGIAVNAWNKRAD